MKGFLRSTVTIFGHMHERLGSSNILTMGGGGGGFLGIRTEYTEWQWPFSGVHSIMMLKSAQGSCPPPFTLSTITSKVVV